MPAKFGGLWFEGMTVFVAFTAQADEGDIRKVTDRVPGWAELRVVQVDWPEAQLVDVYEEITRDMVAQEVPYVIGVGVSPKDNYVEVAVLPEQYEREQDAVREAYGRVALEIVASERDQGSACTRYDCWDPPFKGGLSIDGCTSTGVVFKDNGGGSYGFRLLTAGHCTQTGAGWTHDGHNIGETTSTRYHNNSECDCQIIQLPADWEGHRYLKNNNQGVNFLYRKQRSQMNQGTTICQSGKMDPDRRCGQVDLVSYSSDRGGGIVLKKMATADFEVIDGDSGGPVASNSGDTGWGLVSGTRSFNGDGIFSPIEGTEIEWTDPAWKLCVSEDSVSEC